MKPGAPWCGLRAVAAARSATLGAHASAAVKRVRGAKWRPCAQSLALGAVLSASACVSTGARRTSFELQVAGTSVERFPGRGGSELSLEEARLAFGPLYLCPGATAGELCEEAVAEFLGSVVVDALDSSPHAVGTMSAVTAPALSFMYDLGISSLLTEQRPVVQEAAEALGGVSFRVRGVALVDELRIPFRAAVPVQLTGNDEDGDGGARSSSVGIPVIRSCSAQSAGCEDPFDRHDISDDDMLLSAAFDPRPWLDGIDFPAMVERGSCDGDSPGGDDPGGDFLDQPAADEQSLICDGNVELRCAAGGGELARRDCGVADEVCLKGLGCTTELVFDSSEQQGFNAIQIELQTQGRARFSWHVVP